jgi:hypothetical protein
MQEVLHANAMNEQASPLLQISPGEMAQLKGELERTKQWVKRRQRKKLFSTALTIFISYIVMVVINVIIFAVLAAFIPSLRTAGPPKLGPETGFLDHNPWLAWLLLLIPPLCALPPFIPLVLGILVGVPMRRKQKDPSPLFMG